MQYPECVRRSVRLVHGRRNGARSWQELFPWTCEVGLTVKVFEQRPTLYYIEETGGVLELHVDDGHGTGKPEVISRL